jgi:hypothetical protein
MRPVPGPGELRDTLRAALAAERAQDRTLNRERSLDRPVPVRVASPQAGGTTVLTLERPVRLARGAEIALAGPAGTRAATVLAADGASVHVDGAHADVRQVLGRTLHLSERLESALEAAISARAGLVATASGWEPARPGRGHAPGEALLEGLEEDQADALERSLGSDLLLVLGPPGTGKTQTLAHTVLALLLSGERVLLLAPTHAAVDTALARIACAARERDVPAAALLRQGSHGPLWKGDRMDGAHRAGLDAAVEALEARAARLERGRWEWAWGVAGALGASWDAAARLRRLEARAQGVLREHGARVDAHSLLRDARALGRTVAAASRPPRLVGATLAEALVRPPAGPWDAVIVDEAAMAHVPYALWAASLARHRLLLWGDPHQLGPVCPVRDPAARGVLGRSLFHHLGCDRAAVEDPRRPVLRVQHRMAPPIRRLVADAFYDGILQDGAVVRGRPGTVEVLDSAGLAEARVVGGSRTNEVHARMAAARVERLRRQDVSSIAVLTPYRAQVDRLRAAIAERVPDMERAGGLIGTVHSAQGSEHDAVIVDLVATRDDPGRFLDERGNPEAASLLCVALSRARTSLTLLADPQALPHGGVARRALMAAKRANAA